MSKVKIGERWVGDGEPVYIIAEAGSNHNGNFEQALRLIDVAADAGADAVKFQTFKAARLYPKSAGESDYLNLSRPIYDIIQEMEMPVDWIPRLAEYCREKSIDFLSSPFDEESADLLSGFVSAYKIASYELTHAPLVSHLARSGKPLILSTGAATLDEVVQALQAIALTGNEQVIVLQCTASYPTPAEAANVKAMLALRDATGRPVGLSDHTRDPLVAPILATALGACLIEKHFTLSNRMPGPDHRFAVEPDELARLVNGVRTAEQMLGHGRKEVLPVEDELRVFARRSIFTTRPISAGERLGADNLAVLRCGTRGFGLPPDQYEALVGRCAVKNIAAESLISLADVS